MNEVCPNCGTSLKNESQIIATQIHDGQEKHSTQVDYLECHNCGKKWDKTRDSGLVEIT